MKNTKKKGFTVVELVIVIAVIGILSAVLIPTFAGLVNKANNSALQQNLYNAYTTYLTEVDVNNEDSIYAKDEIYFVAKTTNNSFTISNDAGSVGSLTCKAYNFNGTEFKEVTLSGTYKCVLFTTSGSTHTATDLNGYYAVVKVS